MRRSRGSGQEEATPFSRSPAVPTFSVDSYWLFSSPSWDPLRTAVGLVVA